MGRFRADAQQNVCQLPVHRLERGASTSTTNSTPRATGAANLPPWHLPKFGSTAAFMVNLLFVVDF